MKNKIVEFIKKEKDFFYGSFFLLISYFFSFYHVYIFKLYNISFSTRLLIAISFLFEIEFYFKGLNILFPKTKK